VDSGPVVGSDGGPLQPGTIELFETSRSAGNGGTPEHLADLGPLKSSGSTPTGVTTIKIDPTKKRQTIVGFGAALTEVVASLVTSLPQNQQQEILNDYFGPNGSGYTLARTHIGSCDFSLTQYSLDDTCTGPRTTPCTTPDPGWASSQTLSQFSIAHDMTLYIPFLQSAIAASNNTLRILASPWSAPAWMKDNGLMQGTNGNDGTVLPQYYGAYAAYLSDYMQAYKGQGIPIWAITTANEALGVGASRESMAFTADEMNTFIRDSLGPQMKQDGTNDTLVFMFDHNKGPVGSDAQVWAQTMFGDSQTNPYVAGTAVHWYGSTWETYNDGMDALHAVDPTKSIIFTEGTADSLGDVSYGHSSPSYQYSWMGDDYYWKKDAYDWGYWYSNRTDHPVYQPFYRYTREIIDELNHWQVGFIDWNAVLDRDGGPGHIVNPVAATIMLDTTTTPATIYRSPTFYVMRSFGKYFKPGAQVLTTTVTVAPGVKATDYDGTPTQDGRAIIATSALNPDGSTAIQVFNETNATIPYAIVMGSSSVSTKIPAQSLQTIVWTQ
jgi:glucosylceramidase